MILMFEMAHARKDHGDSMLIGHLDRFLVPDRPARLDDGRDAGCRCRLDSISHREEGIGSEGRTLRSFTRLFKGDLGGADTVHLTCTDTEGHLIVRHDDGV